MKRAALFMTAGLIGGAAGTGIISYKSKKRTEEYKNKILGYYTTLIRWLACKQQGRSLVEFFIKHGYKSVAIYGMKELGERLYDELSGTDIEVKYIIDKKIKNAPGGLEVKYPDQALPDVDVIVVTADYYFVEIEKELSSYVNYPVYSLSDILCEM